MTDIYPSTRHNLLMRQIAACIAVLLSLVMLAGCSGGEDGSSSEEADAPAGQVQSDLPDGFPSDLPVPDHSDVKVTDLPIESAEGWVLAVRVRGAGESLVDDYAELLEQAGFSPVDEGNGQISAEGDGWSVEAHSVASGLLTLTVRLE